PPAPRGGAPPHGGVARPGIRRPRPRRGTSPGPSGQPRSSARASLRQTGDASGPEEAREQEEPARGLRRYHRRLQAVRAPPLRGLALPGAAAMRTPLGDIPVEEISLPQDPRAHAEEHSLEVEVPFLQVALRSFTLVPLAVGEATPDEVAGVLEQLWGGASTLIVVSSDLSHYLPYPDAQRADAASAKEILALGRLTPDDACGAAPVNGLLLASKRRG